MSEGTGKLPEIPPEEEIPKSVHVTSYPKIIFLWPTWLLAFIYWLIAIIGSVDLVANKDFAWLFIGIFAFNMFVVSFEFSSSKFFLMIVVIAAVIIGFLLLDFWEAPNLGLTKEFYLTYTVIFTIIYGLLWLSRRFNYLEVSSQQINYHMGIMADERRYPAPSCRFEKRTVDVFERIMPPFCAKLIMRQEGGEEAEIMDCVPRINKRLKQIEKVLEHLRVKTY
ncbi:MAG: hypothetical protein ACTSRC_04880 [Candidatus Helarchaeota archaeon]